MIEWTHPKSFIKKPVSWNLKFTGRPSSNKCDVEKTSPIYEFINSIVKDSENH